MTFRIKLLSAAALIAAPALAGAQIVPTPTPDPAAQAAPTPAPAATPPAQSMDTVNQAVQESQDSAATPPAGQPVADEQPRQQEEPAEQPANPVDQPAETQAQQPPAEVQQPPAEAQPPAQQPPAASPPAQSPPPAPAGAVTAATAADVTTGAQVRDTSGGVVGTVETVDADSAIVSTGTVRADIPIASFGKNGQGLVLAMTRAQLEAAAQARTPTP